VVDVNSRPLAVAAGAYIVVALAAVVEKMRQILTFYKGELAIFTMTAKNDIARTFWQSEVPHRTVTSDPTPMLGLTRTTQLPHTITRTIRPSRNHSGSSCTMQFSRSSAYREGLPRAAVMAAISARFALITNR